MDVHSPAADPILKKYRTELQKLYGDRITRVLLFGPRARGDARDDSDYDLAVFLKDMKDRWNEFDRLADFKTRVIPDTGAVVHAIPYHADAYGDRTPPMGEIRAEGIDV